MAAIDVAASFSPMALHENETEVGVRELHNRLSEYLEKVERGEDVVVTRRGKPIARLSKIDTPRPLEELERRGIVRWPKRPKEAATPCAVRRALSLIS
jgi:prevent-host-death family protein